MSLFEKQHEKAPEKRANLDEIDVMMDKNASTKNLEKDNADISHRKRRNSAMHQDRLPDLDDLRENAGIVVIPALIIVLIIVILILDHDSTNSAKASGASAGVVLETDASGNPIEGGATGLEGADGSGTGADAAAAGSIGDTHTVKLLNSDVMESFFQKYFTARLEGDVDTIYAMTGVANQTDEQKQVLQDELKTQAGYIEAYQDIQQYCGDGVEPYSHVAFVTYNVKFRRVDTLAPGIMYCYLKVNDQNEFEIVENLTPEEQKLVNEYLTKHQEVQELVTSTNSKLLEAISSDERLAVVYDAFQSGRIYKEDQSVIDQQVSLIPDTTEATESTAESSGETVESTVVVDPSTASDTETASTETASEQTTISPEATLAVESSSVG